MSEKGKCALAYVFTWLGGLIVLYGIKDNEKNTKIHAAQAIVIGIGYTLLILAYNIIPFRIPFFSSLLYVLYIVLIVVGIVKANNEEDPYLPIVGDIVKSLFSKKIDE